MMKRYLLLSLIITLLMQNISTAEQTVGLFLNDEGVQTGYTLFAPLSSKTTYMIDTEGKLVKSWLSEYNPGNSVYLLPESGNLLRTGNVKNMNFKAGGAGGIIEEFSFDGDKLWSYEYSGPKYLQHHDIERLPNGNILILAWELKTEAEALEAGRDPELITDGELWPEYIIEIKPTGESGGEIVWQWHVWDHLVQDFDDTKANHGNPYISPELIDINFSASKNPGIADCFHMNSIDYNAELDQILLSVHAFSEIWVIDHSTTTEKAAGHVGGSSGKGGDLLYRWGNAEAYTTGFGPSQDLHSQHDARWIEKGLPGEGNILIFNNGQRGPNAHSSVVEITTPVDAEGNYTLAESGKYDPIGASWEFIGAFYSQNISGAHRLPNGNTLICDGPGGTFYEVTVGLEIVWKYINPVVSAGPMTQGDQIPEGQNGQQNQVFRSTRYAPDFSGFDDFELMAGDPIEIYEEDDTTKVEDGSYNIVETGQEKFYNNSDVIAEPAKADPFYGQDAQFEGNAPSYTDNGDGTISDNVTGLMWQKMLLEDKYTFNEAMAAQDTFLLAGYDDWRLPTIKELYSLIMFYGTDPSGWQGTDVSEITPFIDTNYFDFRYGDESQGERIIDAQWATSSEYVDGELMFGVNFADGRIKGYPKGPMGPQQIEKKYEVYFVRGNTDYGKNIFEDNEDLTITDNATGLMWSQDDSQEGMNWETALSFAAQKNNEDYLGYNDWRLPNVKELHSIMDYSRSPSTSSSPAIDPIFNTTAITNAGGETDYPYFWSGTTHANMQKGASGSYVSFGRALGWMQPPTGGDYELRDVHGAGAQRSDPKTGDPGDYPYGHGPQGDVIRIFNYVRLVRDADTDIGVNDEVESNSGLSLYPNPASDRISISFSNRFASGNIKIMNQLGMEFYNGNSASISLSNWPAGVYFVVTNNSSGGKVIVQKFIKK